MSAQREWKPGDVAMVTWTYDGDVQRMVRILAKNGETDQPAGKRVDAWWGADGYLTATCKGLDIRPLVVIDPEDADQVEHLTRALPASWGLVEDDDLLAESMAEVQAALREFANPTPPKPDEPKGLGAVVEDARGVRWVRTESAKGLRNPWQATLHPAEGDRVRSLPYADISAVRVLSGGVTDAD